MFSLESAVFADKSLDTVLAHLRQSEIVDGIMLVGTTATGAHEYSDYDLVVIVQRKPLHLFGITTFVDGVFTELLFYTVGEVELLLDKKQMHQSDHMGWLVDWIRRGKIVYDKSDLLRELKRNSHNFQLNGGSAKKYNSWRKINYNFVQNQRYFQSGERLYLDALDLRLLYSSFELLTGYFTLRDLPWSGEKAVIGWLQENDSPYWKLFQRYLSETRRQAKFELYKKLAEETLEPFGGLWKEKGTSAMMRGDFDEASVQEAFDYWNELHDHEQSN